MQIFTRPFKVPTLKEFRDDPRNKGSSWQDIYGRFSCEECGKYFKPGELVYRSGARSYHRGCIPEKTEGGDVIRQ